MSDIIEKLLEKVNIEIQRIRRQRQEIKRHSEIIKAVHAIFPNCYFSPFYSMATVNISDAKGFTSHDNPDLLASFEALENLGFLFSHCNDYPEENSRMYNFIHPDNFTVIITVWLASDAACHRVIVGYQEVEEEVTVTATKPIYKFQC